MRGSRCFVWVGAGLSLWCGARASWAQPSQVSVTVSKVFSVPAILTGGSAQVSLTINNNDGVQYDGVDLTDNLPSGLTVASPSNAANGCGGTLAAAGGTVTLTGGTLFANDFCQVFFDVTGATPGTFTNTTDAPTVTNGAGVGSASNAADLVVLAPIGLGKQFGAGSIAVGSTTSLTFTVTNPNTVTLDNLSFVDPLPAGLSVATPNNLNGTCLTATGGVVTAAAVTATAGSGSVSMSGLDLAAASSCQFAVDVVGTVGGSKTNNTSALVFTYPDPNTPLTFVGNAASAQIQVTQADVAITKSHVGNFVQGDVGRTYTITVSNPGSGATSGTVTVTETVPTGMTATAMSGTGWGVCAPLPAVAGTNVTCSRSDVLAAGSSYPALTVTVDVALTAPVGTVINVAQVAGGGDLDPANDTANDPTVIQGLPVVVVPTLDAIGLTLLVALLAVAGWWTARRRGRAS